jgi:hypothetical protein
MTSKLAVIVASLSAIALILSGCGSSGGNTHACKNSVFQLTSQSFEAPMTSSMHTETVNATVDEQLTGTLVSKIDYENLNLREDVKDATVKLTMKQKGQPDITQDVKVNVKTFVSLDKGIAAFSTDGSLNGTTTKRCMYVNLTKILEKHNITKDMVKQLAKSFLTTATQNVKCSSNDGTYDKYDIDQNIPTSLPIPISMTGQTKVTLLTDDKYMVHSMSSSADVTVDAPTKTTSHETVGLTVSGVATEGGPSDADLTYASWGNCSEVPVPTTGIKNLLDDSFSQVFAKGVKVRFPSTPSASVLTALDNLPKQGKPMSRLVV